MEYIEKLREYYLLKLKRALGEDVDKMLFAVCEYFLEQSKPSVFNPHDERCLITENDNSFEEICNTMEENNFTSIKKATVFEFYNKIKYLEKKAKRRQPQFQE